LVASLLCLVFLGRCIAGGYWLWQLRNAQRLPEESFIYQELALLSAECGISFPVDIRTCDLLSSPCVSWLSRGTIYVPNNFEQEQPEERSTALAHKLIHEVRRDPQSRFLAELCLSLLCYHPLMLLLRRRQLIFTQELATDRQAAGLLGSLNAYQRGLSLLALRMDSQRTASYSVSVSTNDVIRRIKMLSSTRPSLSRWQEVVSVAAILFVSGIAAAWTANADEPIRVVSRRKIDVSNGEHQGLARTILPW
jgi:beta-lactamase regulating signal transducer with metallopeptidase domain